MKLKKTLLFLIFAIILYLGIGALLLYTETIQRLYIFPGWSIKHGNTDEDNSTVNSDGPIIIYDNAKILSYQIFPKDTLFITSKVEINKQDTLTCYVDETKDTFKFQLKDTLLIEPTEYSLPNKMLVISDIEGNFKGFKSILLGNKIIDNQLNWTFGNNHLVLVGDFFDRGLNITECLWLIYKLEKEAEKQGGKVHFILGNHEIMNLKGELKYVRDKYHENADTLKLDYEKWYTNNTELGRWLRTKNGVEKIGDFLFFHAGIRKDFPEKYSLKEINDNIRKTIDTNFEKSKKRDDIFIGNESPLWYRGIAKEDENQKDIEKTLTKYKASKMIIGHTIFDQIQFLYHQKVIAIDLEHKENSDKGKMFALWFEKNDFKITDQNGTKTALK
ncbi:metallophosphoesterase [Chryseobacterium luquanense]|uniref:Metallophosphoesterase n=1 Tax=Chryseobacterium luquanense TaxID=2983766 RepID=A0ABT3Y0U9_9FLAO|nr:metallophosphoesterase [Chryseobacterium luquanense]MCX8531726.1 metallophosphoesterase [Chryseobacterium luquanense]